MIKIFCPEIIKQNWQNDVLNQTYRFGKRFIAFLGY
jgi:hypothetical protein